MAVHRYGSDAQICQYMPWGPNELEQTRAFLDTAIATQSAEPRSAFEIAITLRETGELIGGCGLRLRDRDNHSGDLGYALRRDQWANGYATEAAMALIRLGFEKLDMHRIWATCDVANAASARVLEKIGMQREGTLRENVWQRGAWRSSYLYAIINES